MMSSVVCDPAWEVLGVFTCIFLVMCLERSMHCMFNVCSGLLLTKVRLMSLVLIGFYLGLLCWSLFWLSYFDGQSLLQVTTQLAVAH